MLPSKFGDTTAAELQHTWLCRAAEQGYSSASAPEARKAQQVLLRTLQQSPLYLWSVDKANACTDHHRGRAPVLRSISDPVIHVDHISAVVLFNADKQGEQVTVRSLVTSFQSSPGGGVPDGLTIMAGVLQLRDRGDGNYLVATNELNGSVQFVQGKRTVGAKAFDDVGGGREAAAEAFRQSVITALEQYNYASLPRSVVVRSSPPTRLKAAVNVAPRAAHAVVHIVVDPEQFVAVRNESLGGEHRSPVPHKRRNHVRVLRHPKWGDKVGTVIPVRECEVNVRPGDKITTPKRVYHVVSVGGKRKEQT